jgi:hypothetical protein
MPGLSKSLVWMFEDIVLRHLGGNSIGWSTRVLSVSV